MFFGSMVAEAAVVTAATQVAKMKEKKQKTAHSAEENTIPLSRKLQWLCNLLWGGACCPTWLTKQIGFQLKSFQNPSISLIDRVFCVCSPLCHLKIHLIMFGDVFVLFL